MTLGVGDAIALVGLAGSVIFGSVKWWQESQQRRMVERLRRENRALEDQRLGLDAARSVGERYEALIDTLTDELSRVRAQLVDSEQVIVTLRRHVASLNEQLDRMSQENRSLHAMLDRVTGELEELRQGASGE